MQTPLYYYIKNSIRCQCPLPHQNAAYVSLFFIIRALICHSNFFFFFFFMKITSVLFIYYWLTYLIIVSQLLYQYHDLLVLLIYLSIYFSFFLWKTTRNLSISLSNWGLTVAVSVPRPINADTRRQGKHSFMYEKNIFLLLVNFFNSKHSWKYNKQKNKKGIISL